MWQLETQLFASSFISLVDIFEASFSTVVTSVVDQSELEKKVVSHCQTYYEMQVIKNLGHHLSGRWSRCTGGRLV